jgi:hypothetical protein
VTTLSLVYNLVKIKQKRLRTPALAERANV